LSRTGKAESFLAFDSDLKGQSVMAQDTLHFGKCHDEPLLIVISGPSGVGKDAVVKRMIERSLPFHFVVTATSREKRENEVDGVDYFFVTPERFEEMIANDELIEYAVVYNQYKGIPKSQVREALKSGKDVMMRLDVQGAARIRTLCPEAVLIFLMPSDEEELYQRLQARKTETDRDLHVRIETARKELERLKEFDYVVVNSNQHLDDAVDTIQSIIRAEHQRVIPRKISL
jgi:guanylate kinase